MNKKPTVPIYKRLLEDLKIEINEGKYKVGDLLPSENDLCGLYHTTRPTVRHALTALINLGYIVRLHGKGSIVTEPKKGLGILSIKGVTAGVGEKSLRTQILEKPKKTAWPSGFFYELTDAEKIAGCIFFSRLRFVNQLPVLYEETYITNKNLPRFITHSLENKSLFKTLNEYYHVEIKEGEQKIWAINSDKNLSSLLKIKINNPILHMKRKLKTDIANLNIYSSLYCNTQEYFLQDYF